MADTDRRDALVERLFGTTIQSLELFSVYLGTRLGLYELLARAGEVTPDELAAGAGIHPRYAREWLEQQAVADLVEAAGEGRFRLPDGHADVLADPESTSYIAPFALLLAGIGQVLPDVVEAYRTGGGVPYAAYGADLRDGQAAINRPGFAAEMGAWVGAMPDVAARLSEEPPARVAEVACGAGWGAIALARAFPKAKVDGFDLDEASIADAQANLAGSGVEDRVTFEVRDGATSPSAGLRGPNAVTDTYDLVCIFEALHDVSRPVEVLAAMRSMLAPASAASVLVADERVAEQFAAPGDEIERMMYGWSVLHCLPAAMVDDPTAATGTVMRESTLRRYATDAGLGNVEVLPVENDFFRLYRLRPA